jgi:hypothetical protein
MDLQKSTLWRNNGECSGVIKEMRVEKPLGIFMDKYIHNICVRRWLLLA